MNAAKRAIFEPWIGAGIITGLVVIVLLIFAPGGFAKDSYEITARFNRADGIKVGDTVWAAGVPVGRIEELRLDENFRVVVLLRIDNDVVLDTDATASIITDGLFGEKFIQLDIGGGDAVIGAGKEISYTESSLVLEDLLELIISRAKQVRRRASDTATESQP